MRVQAGTLSFCRQGVWGVWGSWEHGYAQLAEVPAADPAWPMRTFLTEGCPSVIGAAVEAERVYYGAF